MTEEVLQNYELVVGLEIHAQLSTKSKIFSSDSASFGADPNSHTSIISLGLPGTLPRINEKVVEYAIKMGLATNCTINTVNRFDRKNYFYADLPKGYQITQDELPICQNGSVTLALKGHPERKIRINRIHMEEDAGKSLHDKDDQCSLIDLNRAGVPLIEIVSEPDVRSPEEAAAYFSEIRKLVRYLDICDGNMEEGSLRCDANISIRKKGDSSLGCRCEVKNLNSIRNLQRAVNYEFKRQVQVVERGEKVEQNTLNFDAATGETSVLRSKEMAYDYRYFPEPDLQPLELSEVVIESLRKELPELPEQRIERYIARMGLPEYDASLITADRSFADYFEEVVKHTSHYKAAANWMIGAVQSHLNDRAIDISSFEIAPPVLADLISLVESGKINNSAATQQVFPALLRSPKKPVMELVEELNLLIDTREDELTAFIDAAINKFPDKVKEYHKGKKGVLGLFMGEIMKLSKGKIDPRTVNQMVIQKLESLK